MKRLLLIAIGLFFATSAVALVTSSSTTTVDADDAAPWLIPANLLCMATTELEKQAKSWGETPFLVGKASIFPSSDRAGDNITIDGHMVILMRDDGQFTVLFFQDSENICVVMGGNNLTPAEVTKPSRPSTPRTPKKGDLVL